MPKQRETCTECSKRRQKCDKGTPCGRCVKRGKAALCTREWARNRHPQGGSLAISSPVLDAGLLPNSGMSDGVQDPISEGEQAPVDRSSNDISTLDFMNWKPNETNIRPNNEQHDLLTSQQHADAVEKHLNLASLQLLLPNVKQTWLLVTFHEKRLLWYHGCYHGPSFNSQLEQRLKDQGAHEDDVLQLQAHDLQWIALLFSILAGSLTSASENLRAEWGFTSEESLQLCTQWYMATTSALKLGGYTSKHNINSVQAIATLTMSAHTLGFSSDLHVHLGAAVRIAQSLNLHRIRNDDPVINSQSSPEVRQAVLKKEIGRRLWSQLCIQDWFSIPLAEAHLIHRNNFITGKPANRDHLTMDLLPDSVPTYVSYSNYLYDIAALIADLYAVDAQQNTEYTRYQLVIEYDSRMRRLATIGRPSYFDATAQMEESWPWFVPWARRSLTICFAHKIMMLHRAFLKRSFTNEVFSLTRRTCIAAAKTILNEARQERSGDDPTIWIDHAFCIAAAITLALDASYRKLTEPEYNLHRDLVQECIKLLEKQVNSTLASRGIRMLEILLQKSNPLPEENSNTNPSTQQPTLAGLNTLTNPSDAMSILNKVHHTDLGREGLMHTQDCRISESENYLEFQYSDTHSLDNIFTELFPPQAGFSNTYLFEECLGMNIDR